MLHFPGGLNLFIEPVGEFYFLAVVVDVIVAFFKYQLVVVPVVFAVRVSDDVIIVSFTDESVLFFEYCRISLFDIQIAIESVRRQNSCGCKEPCIHDVIGQDLGIGRAVDDLGITVLSKVLLRLRQKIQVLTA